MRCSRVYDRRISSHLGAILCLAWLVSPAQSAGWTQDASALADKRPEAPIPVRIVHDLVYRDLAKDEDASKDKNKLDLYLPRGRKDFPVLFFVHGGAWMFGDKNQLGMYTALGLSLPHHRLAVVVPNHPPPPDLH